MKIENSKKVVSIIKAFRFILFIVLMLMIFYNIIYNFKKTFKNNNDVLADIEMFDLNGYIVKEKNMSPELKKNDLVICSKKNKIDVNVNDVVVFNRNGSIHIHRIVDYLNENGEIEYITKADNNYYNDNEIVLKSNIIGVMNNKLRGCGWILKCIQSKLFMFVMFIIIVVGYVFISKLRQRSMARRMAVRNRD